jgi:hypothetical protein
VCLLVFEFVVVDDDDNDDDDDDDNNNNNNNNDNNNNLLRDVRHRLYPGLIYLVLARRCTFSR